MSLESVVTSLKSSFGNLLLPAKDLIEIIAGIGRELESNSAKLTVLNATVGTLAAGAITGAGKVVLKSTNATPGTQTTRTAALMIADVGIGKRVVNYMLRITNTGANTFTLGAGDSVTLTGTMTILTNTFRDFTVTITSIGVVTYS